MAVSGKVYGKGDFTVGIINKSATAFETAPSDSAAYELLPVTNVSLPVLNLIESGEIRSNNAGMIELDIDQFRTQKGGFVTMDFECPAERDLIVRLLANVLQDHAETTSGGVTTHGVFATSGGALARPDFTATSSAGIPSLFDIALYMPETAQDIMIGSAVLSTLTMNFDMADGRCLLSGSFYSGMSSTDGFKVEQTLSANSGAATLSSTSPTFVESYFDIKTLDIEATNNQDIMVQGVSFTFENNVARIGRDSNGDAEAYAWGIPSVNITGEISFLMNADMGYDAADNVLQDFLSGETATLNLSQGDGTVNAVGEMNITAEIYSTGVNLDPSADTGAVFTVPFKVVQPTSSGAASGTAFYFEYADSTPASGW